MPQTNVADAHTHVLPLKGRRAVISGGSTGIGRAIAALLAAEGARVFIGASTPEHLDDALARIRDVGEGDGVVLDLAEFRGIRAVREAFADRAYTPEGRLVSRREEGSVLGGFGAGGLLGSVLGGDGE